MKAAVLAFVLGCGGASTQAPPSNRATSPASSPPPAMPRSKTSSGGIIELQGDREKAMDAANTEMAVHCGKNNYTIVQEGEEALDPAKPASATVWRVHYQCAGTTN